MDYDPDFRGPKKNRKSTDVICLYIFVCFILIWFGIGIYGEKINFSFCNILIVSTFQFLALVSGKPDLNINEFNVTHLTCDEDKPYLFYLDISKCNSISFNGCDSPKVCFVFLK